MLQYFREPQALCEHWMICTAHMLYSCVQSQFNKPHYIYNSRQVLFIYTGMIYEGIYHSLPL